MAGVLKRLVLVGAGHAHAGVLREFARVCPDQVELLLLSPSCEVPSSGMLPGYLAGHYQWRDICIDFDALCRAAGARFVEDTLVAIDADAGRLTLASGATLDYDWLSLNLGPDSAPPTADGLRLLPMRPLYRLRAPWEALCADVARLAPASPYRLLVVGGGAAGVETVLSAVHRLRQLAPRVRLSAALCLAGDTLMRGSAPGAVRRLRHHLERHGVTVHERFAVRRFDGTRVIAADGRSVAAEGVLWATAAVAPPCLDASALRCDEAGFVCIDQQLRSVSHSNVFAGGDCASFQTPLPKAGVYAVRMGPVLAHNLLASLAGAPLRAFRPQPRILTLIGTGEDNAVASWGPLAWQGRWVWRWKRRIDQQFLALCK